MGHTMSENWAQHAIYQNSDAIVPGAVEISVLFPLTYLRIQYTRTWQLTNFLSGIILYVTENVIIIS